jgi:aspartate oxidase
MSGNVGVTRDAALLQEAAQQLETLYETLSRRMHDTVQLCRIITEAALLRTETRGGHTRLDYPKPDPQQRYSRVFSLGDDGKIHHETCVNPRPQLR